MDPPAHCSVYVFDEGTGNLSITWNASTFEGVESYSIYYGTSRDVKANLSYEDDQGTFVSDPGLASGVVEMVAVGTDPTDNSSKTSLSIECLNWVYAPTKPPTMTGETYAPTISPTKAPVTTGAPTLQPTKAPTYAGCGSALKLDLMLSQYKFRSFTDFSNDI